MTATIGGGDDDDDGFNDENDDNGDSEKYVNDFDDNVDNFMESILRKVRDAM